MLTTLLLIGLQQAGPLLELDGPPLLVKEETASILRLSADSGLRDAELRVWLPPDIHAEGLEGTISLESGKFVRREFVFRVEPGRPAATFDLKIELVSEDGRTLSILEREFRTAVAAELLRMPFENRRDLPDSVGDIELALQSDVVAHGHRALRIRAADGKVGRVVIWSSQAGEPALAEFKQASFFLRSSGNPNLRLELESEQRSRSLDLGALIEGMAPWAEGGDWRFLELDLNELLGPGEGLASLRRLEIVVEATAQSAEVDLDELILGREATLPALRELRDLTQRYHAESPDEAAQIRAMTAELAAIDTRELDAGGRVDHRLLDQALQMDVAELELPSKTRGKPASAERFAALLRHRHHLDMEPAELRAMGMAEVRRHQALLAEQAREVAQGKSWREVVELLKSRHSSAEDLPAFAEMAMQEAIDFSVER
ncbi:MAG: DUF885 domain-containing protein, partial [Planctomycetota bacterium]